MVRRTWVVSNQRQDRRIALTVVGCLTFGMLALSGSSEADVSAVTGSAYGYSASVGLFGGPPNTTGPIPTVVLPPGGSAIPITASAGSGLAGAGPARFFTSGPILVSTQGSPGPTGSVTSTATINTITNNFGEVFTATAVSSTCSASEGSLTGSATITGGVLQTDSGDDIVGNVHALVTTPINANPGPNTVVPGHIHVNGAQDNFDFIFNEQIPNADGSLTVNAAHQRFFGPTAVGDLIIGHVVCGVTLAAITTSTSTTLPTTTSTSTTSTTLPTTTSTSTTSTTLPTTTSTSTSSTTVAPTTTSTVPPATSSTVASTTTTSTTRLTGPTLRPRTSIVCRHRGSRWGVRPPRLLICRR